MAQAYDMCMKVLWQEGMSRTHFESREQATEINIELISAAATVSQVAPVSQVATPTKNVLHLLIHYLLAPSPVYPAFAP